MPRHSRHTRKTRRVHRTRRHRTRGAGYQSTQKFFDTTYQQPTGDNMISAQPTDAAIRPVLNSTFKVGGRSAKRGGFSPTIMGSFLKNAQNAIVPLALYSAYHFLPKKGRTPKRR